MTTAEHRPHRRLGHRLLLASGTVLLSAILLLWAWNTLAVELFAAPRMGFRHAIAAEILLATPLLALAALLARRRPPRAA